MDVIGASPRQFLLSLSDRSDGSDSKTGAISRMSPSVTPRWSRLTSTQPLEMMPNLRDWQAAHQ
jgi:hypothetical protein